MTARWQTDDDVVSSLPKTCEKLERLAYYLLVVGVVIDKAFDNICDDRDKITSNVFCWPFSSGSSNSFRLELWWIGFVTKIYTFRKTQEEYLTNILTQTSMLSFGIRSFLLSAVKQLLWQTKQESVHVWNCNHQICSVANFNLNKTMLMIDRYWHKLA